MKATRSGDLFVLALDIGEELVTSLQSFAARNGIAAGQIAGIGALQEVELGYYWLNRKEYKRQTFPEIVELIACNGNLAIREGAPFAHIHVALGREDYSVFGGHLFKGIVAVTAEIQIRPIAEPIARKFDDRTGLFLLDLPFCETL